MTDPNAQVPPQYPPKHPGADKKMTAALCGILLGAFGIHKFILGYNVPGIIVLCVTVLTCGFGGIATAIIGIIEEGQEIVKEYKGTPALDAGLISAAQAVEHYEIARYGTLKAWAEELGLTQAMKLLDATLAEEKNTDASLSKLAESRINQQAEAA